MRAFGLLGFTLVLMAVAGCGESATQKATDDLEKSVQTTAQLDRSVDIDRRKVVADKAVVVLDTDVLLGQSDDVLVADTRAVLRDLRGMPLAFRDDKYGRVLASTAGADCVTCTHLIEAAMG